VKPSLRIKEIIRCIVGTELELIIAGRLKEIFNEQRELKKYNDCKIKKDNGKRCEIDYTHFPPKG